MKKKICKILIVGVFCSCGFVWAIGDMMTTMKSSPCNNVIAGIVSTALFFLALWSAVLIHEIGHALWCHWAGNGVVILDIPFVSLQFKERGIIVERNNSTEGLVVPILKVISTFEDYMGQKRCIRWMLICGPVASVISGVIMGLIPHFLSESLNKYVSFCLHVYCNLFLLSQVFIIFNSCRKGKTGFGDFVAVDKINRDEVFYEVYVFGCMLQRTDAKTIIEKSNYLQESMLFHLEDNNSPFDYSNYVEWLLEYALMEEHTFVDGYLESNIGLIVSEAIDRFANPEDENNDYASVVFLSLEYLITKLSRKEKALNLYDEVRSIYKDGQIGLKRKKQFIMAWKRFEGYVNISDIIISPLDQTKQD